MPYRSDAQRRKFHAMLSRGEISKKVVNEYDRASKGMHLPEKVQAERKGRPQRAARPSRKKG